MKIPEMLTEEDRNKIAEGNEKLNIEDENDLVMVHKTEYIPINGIIQSAKDAGVIINDLFYFNGKEYPLSVQSERETVHFCLNGEVTSHSMGNFDDRKYAIIIPFNKINRNSIIGGKTVDIYTKGSVNIPEGSFILCPQEEVERIKELTKNLNVVGYEGKSVDGYANMFLSQVLGYKKQKIAMYNWTNLNDDDKALNILSKLGFKIREHTGSEEDLITRAKIAIHVACQELKIIEKEGLITDSQSFEEAMGKLKQVFKGGIFSFGEPSDTIFNSVTLTEQLYEELDSVLGIKISNELKENFWQMRENVKKTFKSQYEETLFNEKIIEQLMTMTLQEILFKSIFNRNISELTEYQKQFFQQQIRDKLRIIREKEYVIEVTGQKESPLLMPITFDSENLIKQNIGDNEHFFWDEVLIFYTDFKPMQDYETIGQYFTRMKECISLIERFISGEKIEFDENGLQKKDDVANNILDSAIEATKEKTKTGEMNKAYENIVEIQDSWKQQKKRNDIDKSRQSD